jgi:hypothetical protein
VAAGPLEVLPGDVAEDLHDDFKNRASIQLAPYSLLIYPHRFSEREVAAVQQWMMSDLPFHIMRDHPQHKTTILGGMWGARYLYILILTVMCIITHIL